MNSEGSVQSYPVPLRTYPNVVVVLIVLAVVRVVEAVVVWQDQCRR